MVAGSRTETVGSGVGAYHRSVPRFERPYDSQVSDSVTDVRSGLILGFPLVILGARHTVRVRTLRSTTTFPWTSVADIRTVLVPRARAFDRAGPARVTGRGGPAAPVQAWAAMTSRASWR